MDTFQHASLEHLACALCGDCATFSEFVTEIHTNKMCTYGHQQSPVPISQFSQQMVRTTLSGVIGPGIYSYPNTSTIINGQLQLHTLDRKNYYTYKNSFHHPNVLHLFAKIRDFLHFRPCLVLRASVFRGHQRSTAVWVIGEIQRAVKTSLCSRPLPIPSCYSSHGLFVADHRSTQQLATTASSHLHKRYDTLFVCLSRLMHLPLPCFCHSPPLHSPLSK